MAYETKEFPRERMFQLREEMGVSAAHETRMASISLLNEQRDEEDLVQIFTWMDEAAEEYERRNAAFHVRLKEEMDAWEKIEMAKFNADLEASSRAFREKLSKTLEEALARL